jgi:hypothetical protein
MVGDPSTTDDQAMDDTKRPDRTLLAIGAAVLGLVALSLISTITRDEPEMLPPDTPEGTVQRYVAALLDRDEVAGMLGDTSPHWCRDSGSVDADLRVVLIDVDSDGDESTVTVSITETYGDGPFGVSEYETDAEFLLEHRADEWKIVDGPWELAPICEVTS